MKMRNYQLALEQDIEDAESSKYIMTASTVYRRLVRGQSMQCIETITGEANVR